jgi:hypothetical protein
MTDLAPTALEVIDEKYPDAGENLSATRAAMGVRVVGPTVQHKLDEQRIWAAYQNAATVDSGSEPRIMMEAPDGSRIVMSEDGVADVDEMMRQQQPPVMPPEETGILEQIQNVTRAPGEFLGDVVQGGLVGIARGLGNIQDIIPIPTITTDDGTQLTSLQDVGQYFSRVLKAQTGVTAVVKEPEGIAPALASGVGQVLPGIIPAVKAMKIAGMGPILAETIGGVIGDFATSSKTEAEGLSQLIGMVPWEFTQKISTAIDEFIADPDGIGDEDLRGRLVATLPGGFLTPVIGGLIRLVSAAKKSGVAQEAWAGMRQRWDEDKSPIKVGMSIEDVGPGPVVSAPPLSRKEVSAINKAVGRGTKLNTAARAEAERIKSEYPVSEGWTPIEVTGVTKNPDGSLKSIKFRQPAYAFHNPPKGVSADQWRQELADAMVSDVRAIIDRARGGDKAAQEIIRQADWYRAMRTRLRTEFGGMGDVFADLLGSTSAQTGVEQNWDNAIEILRRFSRGEYDAEIGAYSKRVETGGDISSKVLHPLDVAGEFPLIRSAAGSLFNANSPAATGALLDLFRQIKAGRSPKTPNFTGNLIGYTNDATIDVWAARYLRGVAGLDRIPPPTEKAVAGKHLVGSTLDEPRIGGEFKFGQDVFEGAVRQINADGFVKQYAPDVGDLGPDDLQAVVWFMEKEKWTANGWTTKAGEGGSLDYEASFAGQLDQGRVKKLRRLINAAFTEKKYTTPKRKKGEGDAAYETRITEHRGVFDQKELDRRAAFDQQRQGAQDELSGLSADLERTTLGISAERPGDIPSNYRQAEVAAEFDDVLRGEDAVVAYKANSTIGRLRNVDERALDVELVTKRGFDPDPLTRRLVELGKEYDQDSVFISKVVDATHENARPGIEVYFRNRVDMDVINKLTELLNANGIDGFTFVTDMRHGDRVNVQAMAGGADTAGITGLRMQYIPEYDETFNAARRVEKMAEIEVKYGLVVSQLKQAEPRISAANVLHYDATIFFKADYDGYLRSSPAGTRRKVGERRPRATVAPQQSDGPRADSP